MSRGLLAAAALIALFAMLHLLAPAETVRRGWLIAFAICSTVPIGAMLLLMIHRLTGGGWGIALSPVLRAAATLMPLVTVAFLPLLFGLHDIYPWAADPSLIPADVARWYLNGPAFALRAVVALGGWTLLGMLFAARRPRPLFAALGLAFFGLTISMVAVDWYLSLQPHFTSSAFAAMIAVQQLLAALAIAAVISPPPLDDRAAGDVGALLITALLGVIYLEYMSYLVAWYGDLPDKAAWYLARSGPLWQAVTWLMLAIGFVMPFFMLLWTPLRHSRQGLRAASVLILLGTGLHIVWLLAPGFATPTAPVIIAVIATSVMVLLGWMSGVWLRSALPEVRHAG
jgi:hypothetical protein